LDLSCGDRAVDDLPVGRAGLPTVLRIGPYRFFFYSGDRDEPPHVHVEHDGKVGKVWIDPVRVARIGGFRGSELREIERLITDNRVALLEAWNDFFGG
jgi:hypothetical protein